MNALEQPRILDIQQGCPEWHALRKTKITATDSCVIMGVSPWKTKLRLYNEKISNDPPRQPDDRMQRGIDLEPIARDLFNLKTGLQMAPKVIVKDWLMASLDGIDESAKCIVEIKCPGEKDHALAIQGRVPDHYFPQLQHQMFVSGIRTAFYFSFDGIDGVIVEVKMDDEYVNDMLDEERKFYECLINRVPPETSESDFVSRDDCLWQECATKWKFLTESIRQLQEEEESLRKQLIFLSGESNTKGGGISLCQIRRKGSVDYSKVPQLAGIDLEQYRKSPVNTWRITCD